MYAASRERFATVAGVIRREDVHTAEYISVFSSAAQCILPARVQLILSLVWNCFMVPLCFFRRGREGSYRKHGRKLQMGARLIRVGVRFENLYPAA